MYHSGKIHHSHRTACRRASCVLLPLGVAVLLLLLLLQCCTPGALVRSGSAEAGVSSGSWTRGLLSVQAPAAQQQQHQDHTQQQQKQQQLLSALAEDSQDDDPFAAAHAGASAPLLTRLARALPKTLQQHLQLLKDSLTAAAADHPGSGQAHAAQLHHRRHHHRVVRHNTTHTWVHSPLLQLELPAAWDTINLTTLVRDNLEPDVSFWQVEMQRQPSVQDVLDLARHHQGQLPSTRRMVELRGNRLRFPLMPPGPQQYACDQECDPQMSAFVDAMVDAVKVYKLDLPDMVFFLNTNDAPVCGQEAALRGAEGCVAPVISLSKEARVADLLGPVMKPGDANVQHQTLPWQDKMDKAFFRGVPSCGNMPFPPGCARSWVARMAQINNTQDLDAGIVEVYNRTDQIKADPVLRDGHGPLPVLPRVPMSELPKYRYLLNLDGHTAAYRLGHLLATNSLLLKQESSNVEHYYRSLRPFHHYVPILKHSEHDLMPRLHWARAKQHEAQVQHIIKNANRFAMRYVTRPARVLYWKYVLLAYKGLISDMDEFMAKSATTGSQMEVILKDLAAKQAGAAAGAFGANANTNRTAEDFLDDPALQSRLDTVAALAGEEAAAEEEQQLGVALRGPGSGLEEALLSLAGGDA